MKKHTRASFNGQGINFLTREQMELIHSATLQLLQETGILVQHKGALEMLEKAGCRVVKKHVYMPPSQKKRRRPPPVPQQRQRPSPAVRQRIPLHIP